MNGKIIKYFSRRGFGFITPEDSQDEIFFHVSNYPEEAQPEIGKGVEFDLIETPKGNEARNIKELGVKPEDEPAEDESAEEESPEEAAPEASSLGVGDIKGVGKATAERLTGAGFETVESIASVDADDVSEKTGISAKVAAKIIASAKELL